LENFFSKFGRINFSGITKGDSGDTIGIVLFEHREDAQKSVQAGNGKAVDGSGIPLQLNL
jgi:hypothetical protein